MRLPPATASSTTGTTGGTGAPRPGTATTAMAPDAKRWLMIARRGLMRRARQGLRRGREAFGRLAPAAGAARPEVGSVNVGSGSVGLPAGGNWGRRGWRSLGLPGKLLLMTAAFVMLAEVLIFLPSIANFRVSWLKDRLTAAELASLAAEAIPGGEVPDTLRAELLRTAQVRAVALRRGQQRRLILPPDGAISIDAAYDLREAAAPGVLGRLGHQMALIGDALGVFVAPSDRVIRVLGPYGPKQPDFIEMVLPEARLRAAMVQYALNVLKLSVIISALTAALVYLALSSLLVRPMLRISHNMLQFSQKPEDPSRIIEPSDRADEIGVTERELANMQRQLAGALLQKSRLAELGLAVSKINHDLRNMLANAQLISDRLTTIPDPTVQRFAPKLIASLDRAINFCNDSLRFGRAEEASPRRELTLLAPIVEEAGEALGLARDGAIGWSVDMPETLRIDADRDHLFRILSNLLRNSVQALESPGEGGTKPRGGEIRVSAWREARRVTVEVRDNGPGIPAAARANLFKAFQGTTKKGGTGLGLAIALELTQAHGGTLRLVEDDGTGAVFVIEMPDRAR